MKIHTFDTDVNYKSANDNRMELIKADTLDELYEKMGIDIFELRRLTKQIGDNGHG